jgi:excisionase family DNA binding protein
MSSKTVNKFLRRKEVADKLGVDSATVTRWAEQDLLPFMLTLGGQRRFPKIQIEQVETILRSNIGLEQAIPELRRIVVNWKTEFNGNHVERNGSNS